MTKKKVRKVTVTEYANETGVSRTIILRRCNNSIKKKDTSVKLPEGVTAEKIGRDFIISIEQS